MVECTGLENRRTLTRSVGSNPTSSAIIPKCLYFWEKLTEACIRHPILLTKNSIWCNLEPETEPRKEPSAVESLFKYGIDYQLHFRKGKQYISQKAILANDIAFMYPDGRYRLSTGTADKTLAKAKAQHYLRKIEQHFDRSRETLEPFIEGDSTLP